MRQLIFSSLLLCPAAPKAAFRDHLVGIQRHGVRPGVVLGQGLIRAARAGNHSKSHTSSNIQAIFVGMAISPGGQDVPCSWAELFPQHKREAWAGSLPTALGCRFRNPVLTFVTAECCAVLKGWPQIKTPHRVISP